MNIRDKKAVEKAVKKVFNKPPRNPKRILKILKLIEKIWLKDPDLRLCQLIENCFKFPFSEVGHNHCLYNKEDEELERRLKEVYGIE